MNESKTNENEWRNIYQNVDKISSQEFLYCKSAEIHGSCAGLFDYGPIGVAIKNNIIKEWRKHFIIHDKMFEIESCMLTPYSVLKTSGHVAKFNDFMVEDIKTHKKYRADHLLEKWIDILLTEQGSNMNEDEINQHKLIKSEADTYNKKELTKIMKKYMDDYKMQSDEGNAVTTPKKQQLMFETKIASVCSDNESNNIENICFLRPETAQGIFTNFDKLLKQNYDRIPFAVAQIGHSFRNEISPRNGLIRVREFQQAEIEHFYQPKEFKQQFRKYKYIENVFVNLLPQQMQTGDDTSNNIIKCTINEAYKRNVIKNKTLAYYMARTQLFLERIGININKLRFRQHKKDEMAHYSDDCWDAEILIYLPCDTTHTNYMSKWIECIGIADRGCYDLTQHANDTGVKMNAQYIYKNTETIVKLKRKINYKQINNMFGDNKSHLIAYLHRLNDIDAAKLSDKLKNNNECELEFTKENKKMCYKMTQNMFEIIENKKNISSKKYIPRVVEPSFGIGRILYALLQHNIWQRNDDQNRIVLSLKPRIAPYQVAIIPYEKNKLDDIVMDIDNMITERNNELFGDGIRIYIDTSQTQIGKKYARCDQKGIPFVVTIDSNTRNNNIVALRQRDSKEQSAILISDLYGVISDLLCDKIQWKMVLDKYGEFKYVNKKNNKKRWLEKIKINKDWRSLIVMFVFPFIVYAIVRLLCHLLF